MEVWVIGAAALLAACGDATSAPTEPSPAVTTPNTPTTLATSVAPTAAPPTTAASTTLPASFVDRPPYPSCGDDDSLSLDGVGPPSEPRQCFLAANRKGGAAELTAHEISALGPATYLVYRTNPDRSVDVYLAGATWRVAHCTGLDADDRAVFEAVGCAAPIDVG